MKEYIKKDGKKSTYDYSEYQKTYKRDEYIYRLQKLKAYHKANKNMDRYYEVEEEIKAYKERKKENE